MRVRTEAARPLPLPPPMRGRAPRGHHGTRRQNRLTLPPGWSGNGRRPMRPARPHSGGGRRQAGLPAPGTRAGRRVRDRSHGPSEGGRPDSASPGDDRGCGETPAGSATMCRLPRSRGVPGGGALRPDTQGRGAGYCGRSDDRCRPEMPPAGRPKHIAPEGYEMLRSCAAMRPDTPFYLRLPRSSAKFKALQDNMNERSRTAVSAALDDSDFRVSLGEG